MLTVRYSTCTQQHDGTHCVDIWQASCLLPSFQCHVRIRCFACSASQLSFLLCEGVPGWHNKFLFLPRDCSGRRTCVCGSKSSTSVPHITVSLGPALRSTSHSSAPTSCSSNEPSNKSPATAKPKPALNGLYYRKHICIVQGCTLAGDMSPINACRGAERLSGLGSVGSLYRPIFPAQQLATTVFG